MSASNTLEVEIQITKLIGVMAAAYPNTQITKETIKVYTSLLKDIPLELLTVSVQQCMSESEFMPTIAKLRERALTISRPQHVTPLEAWGVVKKAMEDVGFYRSPTFEDPTIAKAVECIGWQTLCSSENEVADRAHFSKVFEGIVRREHEEARTLPEVKQLQDRVRALIGGRSMPEVPRDGLGY